MGSTRIFFATDLHGSEVCFRKFLNAAKAYGASILICGGDVTGKMMVPIVARPDGTYRAMHLGSEVISRSPGELETLQKTIRNAGYYPIVVTPEELAAMDAAVVERRFEQEMRTVMANWMQLARERLKPTGVHCLMMPGNDDPALVGEVLAGSDYVINADGRVTDLGVVEVLSIGNSNLTPWRCPGDITEEELAAKIETLVRSVRDLKRCIFNIHVPPFDSQLDTVPELDETFKPKTKGGQVCTVPAGSTAVRAAIERYQPLLGLHGHVHESRGFWRAGRTICINPGSDYGIGVLNGVVITIPDRGQLNWTLTWG